MRIAPVFVVCAACAIAGCSKPSATTAVKNDDLSLPLADFTLTERSGKIVTKEDLRGKVWIASFIFTRCTGPCPQVTATVARLKNELAVEADLRFVTLTVDPARDDPDELKNYAKIFNRGQHQERWLFLTGKEADVRKLLIESFKVPVVRNDQAKNVGEEFDHSTRLAVVDKQGNVRGYYQGMADSTVEGSAETLEADLKKLKEKVKSLLSE